MGGGGGEKVVPEGWLGCTLTMSWAVQGYLGTRRPVPPCVFLIRSKGCGTFSWL